MTYESASCELYQEYRLFVETVMSMNITKVRMDECRRIGRNALNLMLLPACINNIGCKEELAAIGKLIRFLDKKYSNYKFCVYRTPEDIKLGKTDFQVWLCWD